MKKTSFIIFASLLSFAVLLIISGCDDNATEVTPPVVITSLNAASVTTPPTLDGVGTDAAWDNASAFVVTVGQTLEYANEFGEIDVTLKAVHTATDIYIYASWADSTENVDKNQWSYDANDGWVKSGNEDRIFFMFDAGDNGTEGADCATMCHAGDGTMSTTGGGHVDVWHWKSARTAPVGCADDKWWDANGRGSDAKTVSAYNDNIQTLADTSDVPMYSGPVTGSSFIIVPAGDSAAGYCDAFDTTTTSGTYPGYYLDQDRDGSRFADVLAQSTYSGGVWTVEFKRALDTTHDDDVAFVIGETIKFSMAVTDNSGGNHSGAGNLDLVIE